MKINWGAYVKLIVVMVVVICGIAGCKTEVIDDDKPEPARFTEVDSSCVKDQMSAVDKLGLPSQGGLVQLLNFLLSGKDEKKFPICTKS